MPKELEEKLKRKAAKKFPHNEERQDAYVYGTLRDTGWKPKRERGSQGEPFEETGEWGGYPHNFGEGHDRSLRKGKI